MTKTTARNLLLILGSAGSLLASCGKGDSKQAAQAAQNKPAPVTIQEVALMPAIYYDEYPGTTVALSQVDLRAQVNGYVTGIFFKEGEHVRKGQKLYEIDRSKYQASFTQATANLAQAKANQARAQKDADRYIYLSKQDAVAKQILDHALTDLENAKAAVASANAAVVSARTDLNFATIVAPFDGTIGLSQVKMGTLVSSGQTLLNTISTDNPVAVDFVINEREIPRFTQIEKEHVPADDSLFTIKLSDSSVYGGTGRLSVVDRAVDPQTGTIKVRLVFPNNNGELKAGMSCVVRVHSQEAREQILVPNRATIEQMGENFIFLAKDTVIAAADGAPKQGADTAKGPHLTAVQQKIVLGQVIGANVVVKSGLRPGDRIIVDGIAKLRSGQAVTTDVPRPAADKKP